MNIPEPVLRVQRAIAEVTMTLLCRAEVRKATKFLSDRLVVTATTRFKQCKRSRFHDIVLKVGEPNFAERRFIRTCKKAGEPVPVRKVQIKLWKK